MNEKTAKIIKIALAVCAIMLMLSASYYFFNRGKIKNGEIIVRTDTIYSETVLRDTVIQNRYVKDVQRIKDTFYITNTEHKIDTVLVEIPIEKLLFSDTMPVKTADYYGKIRYNIHASGYRTQLDSVILEPNLYIPKNTVTINKQRKGGFFVGFQLGYGAIPYKPYHSPYIGVGIGYGFYLKPVNK